MATLVPGEIVDRFNRVYTVVNPDTAEGPPTLRLSSPDSMATPGGGGARYDFEGEPPIDASIVAGGDGQPNKVVYSMDIAQLPDKS